MNRTLSGIQETFVELKGKRAWGLVRTHGSMFFLEIGDPRTPEQENRGEWHLLVEMCHWRFEALDSRSVGSDDDKKLIDQVFASLELGNIECCAVVAPSYDLTITFSTGLWLKTFSALTELREQWSDWSLYTPDHHVWVSDSGGCLYYQSIFL